MENKTDKIIGELGRQIVAGYFHTEQALPSEAFFCTHFQTSRNIIREVFRALSEKKLIEMIRFRGAFVLPKSQWNYLDIDVLEWTFERGADLDMILAMSDVRNLVEPAMAKWAAQRATAQDLVQIEQALDAMKNAQNDQHGFLLADIAFHTAILNAVHNPILQQLNTAIGALQKAIFKYSWKDDTRNMSKTIQEHDALYRAIRCQDTDAAEKVSLAMIQSTTHRLKEIL